jgi:N-acyl-L-homoserine lactone synthetase
MIIQMPSLNDRVLRVLEDVEYKNMHNESDRNSVFRLRYNAYLREGAIPENSERMFYDKDDNLSNVTLVGIYIYGDLAGSIRLHNTCSDEKYLPSTSVFPEFLQPEISSGRKIVDPTRFVADFEMSRKFPELPYITLRVPWMSMEYFDAELMLAAVRSEHQAFYRRLWGNEPICAPRPYPNLSKPICLTALRYRLAKETVLTRMPFFASTSDEREMLFGPNADLGSSLALDRVNRSSGNLSSEHACLAKVRG